MQVADIAIWDIETGGLKRNYSALAEIAMIIIDSETLEEKDRYEAIISPYELSNGELAHYDPKALQYNGLTMSQIQQGKPAKQVCKEIEILCKKHKKRMRGGNGKLIPAGHNLEKFDKPHFSDFLEIHNKKYQDLFQQWSLDTLWITRLKWVIDGSIPNHKLGTACNEAGIQLFDAHRAINDVEANTDLVRFFLKLLRSQGQTVQSNKVKFRDTFKF